MSELKDRLRADLTASIKGREALRSSTIRMVLTALTKAAEAFDAGNRPELAAKEREEAEILAVYLPEQLSAEEIVSIVAEAVTTSGTAGAGMKAMGKVMGIIAPRVKGRAEGGAVAAEVKRQLGV